MTIVVALGFALFLLWRLARRRRANRLAGLMPEAPAFSVAPPVRSLIERGDHRW